MCSLIVICGFVFIALADSISWKSEPGDVPSMYALQAGQPRSVFDRMFSAIAGVPEYAYGEDSYSSPLARSEFVDEDRKLKYRHLLGTTQTGHDTLYRILKGCKPAVVIGTLPLLFAIPFALVASFADPEGKNRLLLICLGLGVTGWIGLCRLVRAETLKLRELEYVQAATCLGVSKVRIIFRHIIPNLMHIVIITAVLAFSGLVLTEAVLSYIGIGLDHSWGAMIDQARGEIAREPPIWWNLMSASAALFALVLSMNVVGDAIRDALDPRISANE